MGSAEGGTAHGSRRAPLKRFTRFVAIDWSGAVGERHRGIAVAECGLGDAAPTLVCAGHIWSRGEVLDWLLERRADAMLVGLDLGMALPFADRGAYFPTWPQSPPDAKTLWRLVDHLCDDDPALAASAFVDHPELARYFRRHGGREGDLFTPGRGRLRVTEQAQAAMGLNPVSNLNLVGAAQVGKASLSGMRMLHRIAGCIPAWPFDADPGRGALLVEIYTSLAAQEAGRPRGRSKMRDGAALDAALAQIGSAPTGHAGAIDDHASDAILTAAWLGIAHRRADLWSPPELTPDVARTEGWTFGAR